MANNNCENSAPPLRHSRETSADLGLSPRLHRVREWCTVRQTQFEGWGQIGDRSRGRYYVSEGSSLCLFSTCNPASCRIGDRSRGRHYVSESSSLCLFSTR